MKRKLHLFVLLLLCLTPVHPILAAANDASPDEAAIAELIRELGDSRYAVRQAAAQKLRLAGRSAAAALEVAAQSDDPEVAFVARELLPDARLGLGSSWPADLAEQARRIDQLQQRESTALLRQVMQRISDPDAIIPFLLARLAVGREHETEAQHYGTVLKKYRDGTADGVLVRMKIEAFEEMVRGLEARAAAQEASGSNRSGRELGLEITASLKDARGADFRKALDAAVAVLRMNIEPAGVKISDMKKQFVLKYDSATKEAAFFLGGSACSKPVHLEFEGDADAVAVAVTQLDSVYFYSISRHGGEANLVTSFEFDYDVVVKADEDDEQKQ